MEITSPEREVDPSSGITKIELLRFYALVAPPMMPHLKGRQVSLVRAPDAITKQLFFQKHLARRTAHAVRRQKRATQQVGKIFIDYLCNGFGATTDCAWSARARRARRVGADRLE